METPRIVYDLDTSGGLMEVSQNGTQVVFYSHTDTLRNGVHCGRYLTKLKQIRAI